MQPPYFLRRGFPPSENERLQTIRDVLCFTPPRKPPHLYKFFKFSKCHLTPCRSSKTDQMRKTRCVKAYNFAGVLSLEDSKSNAHFYIFIYTPKKFFIIPEAGVTTRIMCYLCSRMSPRWKEECSGKRQINLKIKMEVLEMGIVLPTKEAHFGCKSKYYGELLKQHNFREKLKGIKQNFKVANSIEWEHLSRVKTMSKEHE